ncbi:hypothetical protein [uncultured Thiodictyon sp.]|uniref:hypothetical protein n=1 Tax=uncultured Thiodictyon sp. TaxID=1846217 RepID=UPI0025DE0C04|nr:hypothetical protein [uncultured Thiodictyon sp.]
MATTKKTAPPTTTPGESLPDLLPRDIFSASTDLEERLRELHALAVLLSTDAVTELEGGSSVALRYRVGATMLCDRLAGECVELFQRAHDELRGNAA